MKTKVLRCVLALSGLAYVASLSEAQTPAGAALLLEYECSGFRGVYMSAPTWKPDSDALTGQVLRISFRTDTGESSIAWLLNGAEYNKEAGIGIKQSSGFLVLVPRNDRVETYVYSGATSEMFFTQIRSGNALLPNAVKGFRGSCVGGKR